jgi:DHA1 family bicyclomycin/chloramphenicol resistance-like MFS transporter
VGNSAAMKKADAKPSLWLLGIASGLSPFGVTIVVPVLAIIGKDFDVDYSAVQFVISAYLLGLAFAQPFNGFLCDRLGRRPVMLVGFALFVVASAAAAFTTSMSALIALRFLQAVGVSVGTVASRAMVRDTRDASESAEALSYIAAIMGFAPIFAPIIGGWLAVWGGYPAVSAFTAVFGAIIWVLMYFKISETVDRSLPVPKWRDWMRSYRILLTTPAFMAYSLIFGFIQGGFFSFLAVGAAVFDKDFGIDEKGFGLIWGLIALTYVAGAIFSGRMNRRLGSTMVMSTAVLTALFAGWGMELATRFYGLNLVTLMLPMALIMAATGSIIPGSLAGAVNIHPTIAGTSSGLSSALGTVLGGLFTVVAGTIYHGDFAPVGTLIAISTTLTAIAWWAIRWIGRSD